MLVGVKLHHYPSERIAKNAYFDWWNLAVVRFAQRDLSWVL